MLSKNRQFKGYDFSDTTQRSKQINEGYSIILQREDHELTLSTDKFRNSNYHGSYSSPTLAVDGRVFKFSGQISATTKELRAIAREELTKIICLESNPNNINRGFYDLNRQTGDGKNRTVKAKVFSVPSQSNGLMDPIVQFSFELFAENEKIYDPTIKLVEGSIGSVGGFTLPTTLPTTSGGYLNAIELNNEGNHEAPIRIEVIGQCTNPKIINITNKYKYRLNGITSLLVFDNTNKNNIPSERLIVTDNSIDIRAQRNSGSDIYLSPGINKLVVTSDNPDDDPIVRIRFRDTYSS